MNDEQDSSVQSQQPPPMPIPQEESKPCQFCASSFAMAATTCPHCTRQQVSEEDVTDLAIKNLRVYAIPAVLFNFWLLSINIWLAAVFVAAFLGIGKLMVDRYKRTHTVAEIVKIREDKKGRWKRLGIAVGAVVGLLIFFGILGSMVPYEPPTVKGFYLGMTVDEALGLLNGEHSEYFTPVKVTSMYDADVAKWKSQYPEPDRVTDEEIFGIGNRQHTFYYNRCFSYRDGDRIKIVNGKGMEVEATADGAVEMFSFSEDDVNHLFGVSDLSDEEFAKHFIKSYDIPELKSKGAGLFGVQVWEYVSPEGFTLTIGPGKHVSLEKSIAASERSFD